MSAAQLPVRDHAFVREPSPALRALALEMFGPQPKARPAHLAARATIWTITCEAHAEQRAERDCPMPVGQCLVCDRDPGRHVAGPEPEVDPREAAESATAESYGEWDREGGW